jgi:bacteriocin-like protein
MEVHMETETGQFRELSDAELETVTGGSGFWGSLMDFLPRPLPTIIQSLNPQPEPPGLSSVLISPQPQPT